VLVVLAPLVHTVVVQEAEALGPQVILQLHLALVALVL
jgi:hypothetical protein